MILIFFSFHLPFYSGSLATEKFASKRLQAHLGTIGGGLPIKNDLKALDNCLKKFFDAANILNAGNIEEFSTNSFFRRLKDLEDTLRTVHKNLDGFQTDHGLSTEVFDPDLSIDSLICTV